ncbi:hypothetical protein, partial [Kitasatospora sp. NPDC087314]|uniref:hypothetical protein n=1 Tax=Kitasatospora sp. NPDC087314 TaxID=3364068 RepID=UPI0037F82806
HPHHPQEHPMNPDHPDHPGHQLPGPHTVTITLHHTHLITIPNTGHTLPLETPHHLAHHTHQFTQELAIKSQP